MAGKKHYHVQIRRNGAVYGTFSPYAKRSDALADAGSLGAPGVKVAVVSGSGSSCPSCPGKAPAKRRNAPWWQKGRQTFIVIDGKGQESTFTGTHAAAARYAQDYGVTLYGVRGPGHGTITVIGKAPAKRRNARRRSTDSSMPHRRWKGWEVGPGYFKKMAGGYRFLAGFDYPNNAIVLVAHKKGSPYNSPSLQEWTMPFGEGGTEADRKIQAFLRKQKAPAKRRKNTSKRRVGDRVRVPQVDMRYVATIIKRGRAFPGGDVANLVEFGSGRTLWVHDDEVVYRKEDNDPKPSKRRKNTSGKWIQKATAGSKEGVFTAQAKRAGYPSALAFARAVMKRWKAGHKSVENRKTGKMQRVTVTTMRRANLALNMQGRKAPAKRNPSTSRDLPPALARK